MTPKAEEAMRIVLAVVPLNEEIRLAWDGLLPCEEWRIAVMCGLHAASMHPTEHEDLAGCTCEPHPKHRIVLRWDRVRLDGSISLNEYLIAPG